MYFYLFQNIVEALRLNILNQMKVHYIKKNNIILFVL